LTTTTSDPRIVHVNMKIERARVHLADLRTKVSQFAQSSPVQIGTTHHPESRRLLYQVTAVRQVPWEIALIAGDAIQNLMSALDHLAYQLVCVDTGDDPPNPRWIYFPIAESEASYMEKREGKIKGAARRTIEAVDSLKPYKGGNDALWRLYRLNNIEKHRLLLTVASQHQGIHLGQLVSNIMRTTFSEGAAQAFASTNFYVAPATKGPLVPGFVLMTGDVDEEPNLKQTFAFAVALNEAGISEGGNLVSVIEELADAVDQTTAVLCPFLA
jgi:hypothetical protein